MKYINLYLTSTALLLAVLTGCKNEESFDNNAYINSSAKTSNILLKSTIETDQRSFQLALAQPEAMETTFTLKAEPALVDTYNMVYDGKTEMLPAGYYKLSDTEVTIPAGSVRSIDITISFEKLNELDREKMYVLPVTIGGANIGILESARTMYYVFKAAALINVVADIEKNNVYVDWKKPEVVRGMNQMTAEALIWIANFDKSLNTIMGIEDNFLIRLGDSNISNNQLQVAGRGSEKFTSTDLQLPANAWVHVAVVYDADAKTVIVYINGKNTASGALNLGPVDWSAPHSDESDGRPRCFWIGYSYNNDRYLPGQIAECRIWNRALTAEEIGAKNHFYEVEPKSEGLVAYWKFDEGTGVLIKDYSINENHATASAALKWIPVELPASK